MSIELYGAEGFDFQYEVTVWFFLLHDVDLRSLVVEPDGGEDAKAVVARGSTLWTIEIQSKSETTDVDLRFLCDVLFHYPHRQSIGSLLERLRSDDHRIALIVCGGRCTDPARRFAAQITNVTIPADSSHVAEKDLSNFEAALNATDGWEKKDSELWQKRRAARQAYRLGHHETHQLSRRIYVLEEITRDVVRKEACAALKQHGITDSVAPKVFRDLVDHVREARASRGDALPGLREIVTNNRAIRAFADPVHVPRLEESPLLARLRAERVLLLTGDAQCGKSHLGRVLCQQLQLEGFAFERGDEVDTARRFLEATIAEDRVFFLEDPFDDAASRTASGKAKRQLEQLIRELPAHRLLVVTSRNESLRLFHYPSQPASVDGHHWIDVTLRDLAMALKVWQAHARQMGVSEAATRTVQEHLVSLKPTHLLQPGHLRHLARNLPPGDWTGSEIERVARFNASTVALEMHDTGKENITILVALALTATPIRRVAVQDLTFILSSQDDQPGILTSRSTRISSLGATEELKSVPSFPEYTSSPEPDSALLDSLDMLDRRGWIRRDEDSLWFAHPDYWQAANQLPCEFSTTGRREVLLMLRRAISGLGSSASLGAVRSLEQLTTILREAERHELDQIALLALHSIFPATRDAAVMFLLPRLEQLAEDEQDRVWARLARAQADGEEVAWHQGEPYLPSYEREIIFFESEELLENSGPPIPADEICTAKDAWTTLRRAPDIAVLLRCLQFDEVFLRARAARLLVPRLTLEQGPVFKQILDDHPGVIVALLEGLAQAWPELAQEVRDFIQVELRRAIANPIIAAAAARWVWSFYRHVEDVPHEWAGELWRLWGHLYPTFLKAMPAVWQRRYRADQVWFSPHQAKEHLTQEVRVQIADAWLQWVLRFLQRELLPGDALGVASYLLAVAPAGSDARVQALSQIFEHPETGFVLVSLRAYVDAWEHLDGEERRYVKNLLQGTRPDIEWLHAVTLTTASVTQELVECIVGRPDAFQLPVDQLMALFSPSLLERCISVHLGNPQPLWYLALQFDARDGIWEQICRHLRQVPSHPCFANLWRAVLGIDSGRLTEWRELCRHATSLEHEALFEILAQCTSAINDSFKEHWATLWAVASDNQREAWVQQLAAHVETYCVYGDIDDQFPPEMLDWLIVCLPADRDVISLLDWYHQGMFAQNEAFLLSLFANIYQQAELCPRIETVHKEVLRILKAMPASGPLCLLVEQVMEQSRDRGYHEQPDERSIESPDWIYAYKKS